MREAVALGFRSHSGWAVMVAAGRSGGRLVVIERRRVETADVAAPASKQPYHAAERLDFPDAEALIGECRKTAKRLATRAVSGFVEELTRKGYQVTGSGILMASGRTLPDLGAILRSHALIHTAEGEFYREALARASEACGLPVIQIREREVWDRAAAVLKTSSADLQRLIAEAGRSMGPPWRQDEKLASLAAWIALG